MEVERRENLREFFNSQSDEWRIEAVIHDGNWYDINKWKRVAKVTEDKLKKWIEENEKYLIKSKLDSYRVNYDEIVRWYAQENLDVEENIVPNNFPPKLWNNTTETDVFLNAPRRRVGTVSFKAESDEILEKCIYILKGTGKIMPDKGGRHRAFGLSAVHMRNLLSKGLTEEEYNSLDIKTRAMLMQRELTDMPARWLEEALEFYSRTYAPSILKSSMSTISIYLPDKYDIHSQIMIWVITAMKKFNESASVPFSGYLSSVLRHWPYDLPDEYLGKELSKFQRDRKRAIKQAQKDGIEDETISFDELSERMDMPLSKYIRLSNEHDNWLAEKNATTLTWEDSANEKKGTILGVENTPEIDVEVMSNISRSAVKAVLETEDWSSGHKLITNIDSNDINPDLRENLSSEYLASFTKHFSEMQ